MESVINFLADYYIWFFVAAGVLAFALIGFIIDSKRKKKNDFKGESINSTATPDSVSTENVPPVSETPVEINDIPLANEETPSFYSETNMPNAMPNTEMNNLNNLNSINNNVNSIDNNINSTNNIETFNSGIEILNETPIETLNTANVPNDDYNNYQSMSFGEKPVETKEDIFSQTPNTQESIYTNVSNNTNTNQNTNNFDN